MGAIAQSPYMAFTASSVLQGHILQDIKKLLDKLPPEPDPKSCALFSGSLQITQIPQFLMFKASFPTDNPTAFLYVARMPDKQLVLIEFAQRYLLDRAA